MQARDTSQAYNDRAVELAARYESLKFEEVHSELLDLIPQSTGVLLDVGAGSGRDAAWFARLGWDVIAVEPAARMLEEARHRHLEPQIRWIQDKLPGLDKTLRLGLSFDMIMLSAVWMHINPADRPRAFRKLVSLLKAGGTIIISLRHGPLDGGRIAYPVTVAELEKLARQYGIAVKRVCKSEDRLQRSDVSWETVCLQLPDDGTEALPLLRHTILNDSKSSTYKLALLRVLVRIADSAVGLVSAVGEDYVSIPLGLIALYWVRMYKPLIEKGIPQMPASKNQSGLSFVREAFQHVVDVSPYDLRVGARFEGQNANWLRHVLVDARNTIHRMPAFYITYPNSAEQIFKTQLSGRVPQPADFTLNEQFLSAFGELRIPRHLWLAMSRFASWIEPALITEWIRLMQAYSASFGKQASYDDLMRALIWIEPERDTALVRSIVQGFLNRGDPLFCVWSGKKLLIDNCDIDHCFPFSAWPCGDLWNLLPANRTVNQRLKGDKLVTPSTLEHAKDRLLEWWYAAYLENESSYLRDRFLTEANAALPMKGASDSVEPVEAIFDGLLVRRSALKHDLQLPDWEFSGR